jgi:uncharacterized protein YprB with RNaseH-like and TPR domain
VRVAFFNLFFSFSIMIRNSFIFLPGIGLRAEQRIWGQGIRDWASFISKEKIEGISCKRKHFYNRQLAEAGRALLNYDSSFFTCLPSTETWRLYNHFRDDAVFLDIENYTKGITVIGLFDGYETKTLVRHVNLDKKILQKELSKYKLIITFNGSSYDLPILRKYFGNILPRIPHIDLKHCCSRLGLTNGLKSIEKEMSLGRPEHLIPRSHHPVDLWKTFQASGDREWLETLVKYNEEDIINLKPLMVYCYRELCLGLRK